MSKFTLGVSGILSALHGEADASPEPLDVLAREKTPVGPLNAPGPEPALNV